MKFDLNVPNNLSLGIWQDVQSAVKGVQDAWFGLPFDAKKVTASVRVEYTGSATTPLPTDVIDVEVKMVIAEGGSLFPGADTFKINDLRGDVCREAAQKFRETALHVYEVLAKEKCEATQIEPALF